MRNKTNSLKANAALNVFRRVSAIVFPLLTFTYASHTLGADGIGIYSFCNSVVSYFLLLSALGISDYAVREGQSVRNDPEKLRRLISEVYTVNFMMTVASYALLGVLLLTWGKLHAYTETLLILSVAIILTTVGADWINTLLEDYLFITIRYIVVQMVCFGALIVFVKGPEDLPKYALIGALSSAGGNLLNIWHVRRKIPFRLTRRPRIRTHIGSMITLFSNSLAIKLYLASDIIILGILLEERFVGYYTAASNVYTALKVIINAVTQVTIPRFAFYISHGMRKEYENSFSRVLYSVITLSLPCVAGLYMEAGHTLYLMSGAEYVAGTGALRILSLALPFATGSCLFAYSVLIPHKEEKYFLKVTIISALTNIVLNFPLIPVWGIDAAAFTTLLSEFIVCAMTLRKSKDYLSGFSDAFGAFKSSVPGTAAIIAICAAANAGISSRALNLAVAVGASVTAYAAVTYAMGNRMTAEIVSNVLSRVSKKK